MRPFEGSSESSRTARLDTFLYDLSVTHSKPQPTNSSSQYNLIRL